MILSKTNKTIGLMHKLKNLIPIPALLTIYKVFFRPSLDCSDYCKACNASFHQRLESDQSTRI